jgi:3-methyladenine DNA glycosylase AlkD
LTPVLAGQIDDLRRALTAAAEPSKAPAMAAYMKGHFEYLGVAASARKEAQKPFVTGGKDAGSAALLDGADICWSQPEREFQYVATDLLARWVRSLTASDIDRVERLIRTKSWWDTVDALAANVVGPMVAADPSLLATMDRWIDDDLWIARAALLHQLKYRDRTDVDRLFGYVDLRCGDADFFIRKAAGWALREYAKTDPDAVRRFVTRRGDRLSGLTRREALKRIGP